MGHRPIPCSLFNENRFLMENVNKCPIRKLKMKILSWVCAFNSLKHKKIIFLHENYQLFIFFESLTVALTDTCFKTLVRKTIFL